MSLSKEDKEVISDVMLLLMTQHTSIIKQNAGEWDSVEIPVKAYLSIFTAYKALYENQCSGGCGCGCKS